MARIDRMQACTILAECGAKVPGDFHKLGSAAVAKLIGWADTVGYRLPANANGSRGRYFHAYLQRRAAREE